VAILAQLSTLVSNENIFILGKSGANSNLAPELQILH
jgi:hypothetical protein